MEGNDDWKDRGEREGQRGAVGKKWIKNEDG